LKIQIAILIALGAGLLAGCNNGGSAPAASTAGSPASTSTASKGGKPLLVGIVFDSGGRGDKSFNDSAYAGIERAEKDLGIQKPKLIDSKSEKDYEPNLTAMADAGCDVVFAVGNSQKNALEAVAPKYPNIKFAIIDNVVDAPNVRSIEFNEEQGSFLAGYLAALVDKTGKIGFVGGKTMDLIKKFETGYRAGALTVNPKIEVTAKYTESWDDTALGKASASVLFNDGADVVYHAAGRCGLGVIDAAKDAGKYAIGVDSDQDDVAPGVVLTSMIKHVDEAVYQTIKDVQDNTFSPGVKQYDLKSNGVGLSDFKYTKDKIGQANIDKLNKVADEIKSGKIVVPSKPDELDAYLKTVKR
jgi:basic membrane protein A